jgi:hypothetical protein
LLHLERAREPLPAALCLEWGQGRRVGMWTGTVLASSPHYIGLFSGLQVN